MKMTISVLVLCLLTGCGYGGAPLLLGAYFDRQDPCQSRGRPNYQYPAFCGAAAGPVAYVRDYRTGRVVQTIRGN
jgi:hypothetical protein